MSDPITKDLEDYLRASRVVEALNANLPECLPPINKLPAHIALRSLDRNAAGVALMATVEALGGIPGLVAWAAQDQKNQGKVYDAWFKTIPAESKVEHSGNLIVNGALGDSVFDDFEGDRNADGHASH